MKTVLYAILLLCTICLPSNLKAQDDNESYGSQLAPSAPKMMKSSNGTVIPESAILVWARNHRTGEVVYFWTGTKVNGHFVPLTPEQTGGYGLPGHSEIAAIMVGLPPLGFINPRDNTHWDGTAFVANN